jgi:hypothetical protein
MKEESEPETRLKLHSYPTSNVGDLHSTQKTSMHIILYSDTCNVSSRVSDKTRDLDSDCDRHVNSIYELKKCFHEMPIHKQV